MRIKRFIQTPFITHDDKNKITVSVTDWDNCNPYFAEIYINGCKVFEKNYFAGEFQAFIPCCDENSVCTVKITPFEDLPVERSYDITPPKKWEIPLLYSSHEDLGYCAYIEKLHRECYDYLKVAMSLCEKYDGFKYMIEHYWWLDAFDTYATDEEKQQLMLLLKSKKIELNAIHSGVHTGLQNAEILVRQMYFGCRDAKKKYGVSPEIAYFVDLSGFSWSCVDAYADMGIKYMATFINPYRNCRENKDFPPIFWLKSKSGEKRVLFWHQWSYRPLGLSEIWCDTLRQYPEGEFFFDETKALKTEKWFTEKLSSLTDCGYDILPISFYDDRELPTSMLITVCEEMNRRYKYPHFKMEVPSVFMHEIEEKYGDILPEFSGEISDQWGYFPVFSPVLSSKRREIPRLLHNAEMKSAFEMVMYDKPYNNEVFEKAIWNTGCFDEHCMASSSKHPLSMHRHNIDKVKKEPVESSFSELLTLQDNLFGNPENNRLSITNMIPQGYNSGLKFNYSTPIPEGCIHQILPDNSLITEPIHFECAEVKNFDAQIPFSKSEEIFADCIETDFYKVYINNDSKRVSRVYDKILCKELLDKNAEFDFGQFIYIYCENQFEPYTGIELAKNKSLKIYDGDVAYVISINAIEEQSGAEVEMNFTFFKKERNIDIKLSYKNATGLMGDFYDRYKKHYFFALPFNFNNPEFYTELPCGEKNEKTDIIRINASDFTVANNWLAAENDTCGVAVYTRDMPVFHLGHIKINNFSNCINETKAHFYLHAAGNVNNSLVYRSAEDCCAEYHLSVLPYEGEHLSTVSVWSNEKDHAPVIGEEICSDTKYLSVDKTNVRLVSVKKAEEDDDALIFRFIETSGVESEVSAKVFFNVASAVYVTNSELETGNKIITDNNIIRFNAKPFDYTVLKVFK